MSRIKCVGCRAKVNSRGTTLYCISCEGLLRHSLEVLVHAIKADVPCPPSGLSAALDLAEQALAGCGPGPIIHWHYDESTTDAALQKGRYSDGQSTEGEL